MSSSTQRLDANTGAEQPLLPNVDEVRAWAAAAATLPTVRAPERFTQLCDDYARGRDDAKRALVVALIGSTGAGKSTLLNALAGSDLSREGEHRPTSRAATVFAPDDAVVGPLASAGARVVRYTRHEEGLWTGQVFVDTPDLNSVETANREVARNVLEHADVALVVLHRSSVVEARSIDFLSEFARRRQLVFVVNFADELGEDARASLKDQVRRLAAERFEGLRAADVPVFSVSAREAKTGGDPSRELQAFLASLRALGETATRERVLRSNAVGSLRELGALVESALVEQRRWESSIQETLVPGITSAFRDVEEGFAQRLDTTLGHLKVEVRQEAATRWWGPAAWLMRLSGVGGSGLGAAALLARANPVSAAALAAGSAAASLIQRRTLSASATRRVESAGLGDDGELARAARTALSGTSAVAARLGSNVNALGLPDAEELTDALRTRVAETWRHTQSDAVGRSVVRWWRWAKWLLVPLINLPLLALLGDVIYRVVRAYLFGPYLGIEYFVNAGALGAVLASAGALLGSLSLAGVAKRAARDGRERLAQSLEGLKRELIQAPGRAHEAGKLAAESLTTRAKGL